jgi:O-antigen ligase
VGYGSRSFVDVLFPLIGSLALLGHPHSNYMQQLFRYGIIGLVLFLALLLAFVVELRRGRRTERNALGDAALAALIVFAVDSVFNNSLSSLNVTSTLFLLVGLGCSARSPLSRPALPIPEMPGLAGGRPPEPDPRPPPTRLRR